MYSTSTHLSRHNKTAKHLERKEMQNTDLSSKQSSLLECGASIKLEDVKEEIKEEESFTDNAPFPIILITESIVKQEINEELKESYERLGFDDSNLDTDHLLDCSDYVQVQMNLTN
jgi:hypothetical protein